MNVDSILLKSMSNAQLKSILLERYSSDFLLTYCVKQPLEAKTFCNPFRKDQNPGCKYLLTRGNTYIMYDFSRGESYSWVRALKEYYGEHLTKNALVRAIKDFEIQTDEHPNYNPKKELLRKRIRKLQTKKKLAKNSIVIHTKEYSEKELKYWKQFSIKLKTLKKFNVHSIHRLYNKGKLKMWNTPNNPVFGYFIPEQKKFRTYRPLTKYKSFKWWGSVNDQCIFGLRQLDFTNCENETLIITSSLKDVMCLHEMGIKAIAAHSEGSILSKTVVKRLLKRFKSVLVLMNTDTAGEHFAHSYRVIHGLETIFIPKQYESKDPSDLVKNIGFRKAKRILVNL